MNIYDIFRYLPVLCFDESQRITLYIAKLFPATLRQTNKLRKKNKTKKRRKRKKEEHSTNDSRRAGDIGINKCIYIYTCIYVFAKMMNVDARR